MQLRPPHDKRTIVHAKRTTATPALALLFLCLCASVIPGTTARAEEIIRLDPLEIKVRTDRVKSYSATMEKVWGDIQGTRKVCYLDILVSAYPRLDIAPTLLRKKEYRETIGKNYDWFCNYGATTKDISVRFDVQPSMEGKARSYGGLDWKRRIITISDEARSELLYHFAGLALSSHPSKKALARVKELGRAKKTRVFVDATFQESQLQELNRLYYTLTGKVILSPIQTVEALTLCGATLDRAKVAAIMDRHRIKYQPAELDHALTIIGQKDFSGYFRYAISLVQGTTSFREWFDVDESGNSRFNRDETNVLQGLADLTGEKYDTLLETILLTAPGHI